MDETKKVHLYVLETQDMFGERMYYAGDWSDKSEIEKAKRYTLDEAMKEARHLREWGLHYRSVRVDN